MKTAGAANGQGVGHRLARALQAIAKGQLPRLLHADPQGRLRQELHVQDRETRHGDRLLRTPPGEETQMRPGAQGIDSERLSSQGRGLFVPAWR